MLNNLILDIDWDSICRCDRATDIDIIVERFYETLNKCLLRSVPKIRVKKSNKPPWYSSNLTKVKNLKSRLFKKFKKTGTEIDFARYSVARSQYNIESYRCYNLYLEKISHNFKSNPKSFYDFVNLKRKTSSNPSRIRMNGVEYCGVRAGYRKLFR